MDINNFIIDRATRAFMVSPSTGDIMWSISQIEEPKLNVTSEKKEVVDAIGSPISSFERGKKAEFTANSTLFDLGLYAAQMGTEKKIASTAKKIKTPKFETFDIIAGLTEVTLAETPVGVTGAEIKSIYELKGDSSLGVRYSLGATASASEFELDISSKKITLPTGLAEGSQILVQYEYMSENAVEVAATAIDFPKSGKFIMEVFGHDVCNQDQTIFAYLILPNSKLNANVDITFTTEGKHPFTLAANQNYCDKAKKLFNIIIPGVN